MNTREGAPGLFECFLYGSVMVCPLDEVGLLFPEPSLSPAAPGIGNKKDAKPIRANAKILM